MDRIFRGNGSYIMDELYIGTEEELMREARWAEEHIPDQAVPALDLEMIGRIWERIMKDRRE